MQAWMVALIGAGIILAICAAIWFAVRRYNENERNALMRAIESQASYANQRILAEQTRSKALEQIATRMADQLVQHRRWYAQRDAELREHARTHLAEICANDKSLLSALDDELGAARKTINPQG